MLIARNLRILGIVTALLMLVFAPIELVFGLLNGIYGANAAPHTHPLTIICLAFAVIATRQQRPLRLASTFERGLWICVILVAVGRPWLAPIINVHLASLDLGHMGWNTALSFILLSASQITRNTLPKCSLTCGFIALFLPLVALNGISLGQQDFFGQMSLVTAIALFSIGLSNMMRFARRPTMRLILIDSPAGRLVRHQISLWLALAVLMPLGIRLTTGPDHNIGFATLYTMQMCLILAGIVYFGTRFVALLDSARKLERNLLVDVETDPLTGSATRRAVESYYLRKSWQVPMAVILIDLDHFKNVNDTHGHNVGDAVLRIVATALRNGTRLTDLVARWGGEEFLVIMPIREGVDIANRIEMQRKLIATMTDAEDGVPAITASFGVTVVPAAAGLDLSDVVRAADAALYSAKAQGRNRVVFSNATGHRVSQAA